MYLRNLIVVVFFILNLFSYAVAKENDKANETVSELSSLKQLVQECAQCHGESGVSANDIWPSLAAQHKKYNLKQLHEFMKGEEGKRNNPVMYAAIEKLSENELEELAEFYSKLKAPQKSASASKVDLGFKIYMGGNLDSGVPACAACHSANGSGNELANFPRVAGQNPGYIADQLMKFKKGERSNDHNEMMQDIAKKMTDEEIAAVSSYMAGLRSS